MSYGKQHSVFSTTALSLKQWTGHNFQIRTALSSDLGSANLCMSSYFSAPLCGHIIKAEESDMAGLSQHRRKGIQVCEEVEEKNVTRIARKMEDS